MFIRSLISLLLIASFSNAAIGSSGVQGKKTPKQTNETKLTPHDEREARALAEMFFERMEKTGDVTPVIKELYVSDFTDRMRDRMNTLFPLASTPEVAAQMSADEIIRAYTASINCMYLASRLFIEWEQRRKQESARQGEPEERDECEHPKISEIIPPNVLKLIQSDPLLATLLDEAIREEKEAAKGNDPGDAPTSETNTTEPPRAIVSLETIWPFRSLEEIRHYTSLMEQGIKLLREHIESLPPQLRPSITEFASGSRERSTDDETDEPEDKLNIRNYSLDQEFMGYSAGTQIICANVLIFHMDMVRGTNGRLEVLYVYVMLD